MLHKGVILSLHYLVSGILYIGTLHCILYFIVGVCPV